jgi:YD repeat-containing protein
MALSVGVYVSPGDNPLGGLGSSNPSTLLQSFNYAYDRDQVVSVTRETPTPGVTATMPYRQGTDHLISPGDRPLESIGSSNPSTLLQSFNYSYDRDQVVSVARENTHTWRYGYDAKGQVASAKKRLGSNPADQVIHDPRPGFGIHLR